MYKGHVVIQNNENVHLILPIMFLNLEIYIFKFPNKINKTLHGR